MSLETILFSCYSTRSKCVLATPKNWNYLPFFYNFNTHGVLLRVKVEVKDLYLLVTGYRVSWSKASILLGFLFYFYFEFCFYGDDFAIQSGIS